MPWFYWRKKMQKQKILYVLFLFFALSFPEITNPGNSKVFAQQCLGKDMLPQTFEAAVADARIQEDCELTNNLISINKNNPKLVWEGNQVLVLSWLSSCDNKSNPESPTCKQEGAFATVKNNYFYWVTTVPEVKEFIARNSIISNSDISWLRDRLKKYLGLRLNHEKYDNFVEIWVDKNDLIRPCVDTNIESTSCSLIQKNQILDKDFSDNRKSQWPFTGLGYTYDWGSNETDIGASEFVIKKGAKIRIKRIIPTDDYIRSALNMAITNTH